MIDNNKIPLRDPSEIPEHMSEEEARDFWDTHEVTEEYLDKAGPVAADELPPIRRRQSKPVAIRFDEDILARLKELAETKHKGYQTLLKEFVVERLYEEEKREGILH
jgi:uncharacterized protein (DUF4415 family)